MTSLVPGWAFIHGAIRATHPTRRSSSRARLARPVATSASLRRFWFAALVVTLLREASGSQGQESVTKAKVLLQGASARAKIAAIPGWKLDMTYNPDYQLSSFQEGAGFYTGARQPTGVGSTPGQDRQRCPVIKLPDDATVVAEGISWRQQWGVWKTSSGLRAASWVRDFLTQAADSIHIRNMDGTSALKILSMTESNLLHVYGWQEADRGDLPPPGRASYESGAPALPADQQRVRTYSALLDCEGSLLFVARFEGRDGADVRTELFDREGSLIANTIDDPAVARQQFVDPNGYLLATAEAPGVFANLSRTVVPKDPNKGNVMPYGMHFETGGYVNASRLMDVDYRYAIAASVLARAVREASPELIGGNVLHSVLDDLGVAPDGRPTRAAFLTTVAWASFLLFIIATFCCLRGLFRLVYFDRRNPSDAFMRPEKIRHYGGTDMESSVMRL